MKTSTAKLSNIMRNAWAIANNAAQQFGGKSREYIAKALEMAWQASKTPRIVFCENRPTNYSKATFGGVEQYGAWIDTYKVPAEKLPKAGDKVAVKTKAGEVHIRTIGKSRIQYKSGAIYQLVADAEVAKKATERYQAKAATTKKVSLVSGWCNKCGSYCYGDCTASLV